jgi:hypothetical protein
VLEHHGIWQAGEALEVEGPDHAVIAKGIARISQEEFARHRESETRSLLIHRDDLVILIGAVGAS